MARPGEFVDPDYDRRLAAFKAQKAAMKAEMGIEEKPAKSVAERTAARQEPVKSRDNTIARRY